MSAAGGGGGQPLKILFQILGINEAKSALTALVPEVTKIGQAADAASGKISGMAGSVQKTGSSGSGLKPIADNMDKIEKSGTGAAASTTKVGQSMDKTKTSTAGFSSSAQQTTTNVERLRTGEEGLASTGQKVTETNTKVTKTTDQVKTSSTNASVGIVNMSNSENDLTSSSGKTTGSLDKQTGALKGVGDESKNTEGGLTKVGDATDKVDKSTQTASGSQQSLKSQFASTMGAAASLGGGITGLWQSFDSLGDAQLKVDKASNALQTTQLKAEALQIKLNKLVAEGKTGTDEYRLVSEKLELAQKKVTAAEGTLQNAQEDLNVTNANFYSQIIPQGITVLGSLTTLLSNSSGMLGKFKTGITGVGVETSKTSKLMSLISLTNPFFLALTIGGGIITAFVTNLFGFRDAINGIGVALGNALGPLKPFLVMIGDLGQGIVNAVGMGGDATKAYAETTKTSMDSVGGAFDTAGEKTTGYVSLVSRQIRNADGEVVGFTNAYAKNMEANIGNTDAFGRSIGTLAQTAKTEFGKTLQEAQTAYQQLQSMFNKSSNLNGITASGLPGENTQYDLPKQSDLLKNAQGSFDAPKLSQKAKDALSGIQTQFDPSTQKLLFNQLKLQEAYASGKLTLQEYGDVMKYVTDRHNVHALVQDTDISQKDVLKQKTQEAINLNSVEGRTIMDIGTLAQKRVAAEKARLGILGQATGATNKGTNANIAYATSMDEQTQSSDQAAQSQQTLTAGQKFMQDMTNSTADKVAMYNEILNNSGLMADVAAEGQGRQIVAMKQAKVEVVGNAAASLEYAKQLRTAEGQTLAFAEGLVKEQDALNQAKVAAIQTRASVELLSQATVMAEAQQVAWTEGFYGAELAMQRQQIATAGVKGEIAGLIALQTTGEAQLTAYNKGFFEQEKQLQLNKIAIFETRGQVDAMRAAWIRGEAQIVAYNQGMANQAKAFEEAKAQIFELRGTFSEMVTQWNSGEAAMVAFNTAFAQQQITAMENMVAVEGLKGTYSALIHQFDKGQTMITAINKGYMDQQIAVYQTAEATGNLIGKIKSLDEGLASGLESAGAFIKSYYEHQVAIRETDIATAALVGTVASMTAQINDAVTTQQMFDKGQQEMRKTVLDSVLAFIEYKGSVDAYRAAIQSGLPQTIAYSGAIDKTKMSLMEQEVATAALLGTTVELFDSFGSMQGEINRFNSGFAQGYNDIVKWGLSLEEAKGSLQGTGQAINEVALQLGSPLPRGFMGSTEQAQEFVEVMEGVPETIDRLVSSVEAGAKALVSGIAKSFQEGGKNMEEEVKKIAEKTGMTMTTTMENALKRNGMAQVLTDQMKASMEAMKSFDYSDIPAAADHMMQLFERAVVNNPALESMRTELENALNAIKLNPQNSAAWADLARVIGRVETAGSLTHKQFGVLGKSLKEQTEQMGLVNEAWMAYADTLGNIDIAKATADFKSLTAQAEAAQQAIRRYNDQMGVRNPNAMKASGDTRAVDDLDVKVGDQIPKDTGVAGAGGAAGVTAAQQVAAAWTQTQTVIANVMAGIDARVVQTFSAIGTAAPLVGQQISLAFTTAQTTVATTFAGIDARVVQTFAAIGQAAPLVGTQMTTAFTSAQTGIASALAGIDARVVQTFAAIGQAAPMVGQQVAMAFTNAQRAIATTMTGIDARVVQTFSAIGRAAPLVGQQITTAFKTAETGVSTAMTSMGTKSATAFQQIQTRASTSASSLRQAMTQAISQVTSSFSAMQSRASSTFSSIVSSANRATSAVRSLISAINSLKSKTVTITTVRREVIQRVYAAKGFGPSVVDHPMNLTVGESGPEIVSVIPMSQVGGSSRTLNLPSRVISNSTSSATNKTGISNTFAGNSTVSSSMNENSVINKFNESVSRISNTFDRQESIMNTSSIQSVNNVRGGGVYSSTGGINNVNTTNIPNISSVRGGNTYNTTSVGGGSIEGIIAMVKDIISTAFAQTTINVTSQSIMDSDLVYEKQKKQFGLRNGAMLK